MSDSMQDWKKWWVRVSLEWAYSRGSRVVMASFCYPCDDMGGEPAEE